MTVMYRLLATFLAVVALAVPALPASVDPEVAEAAVADRGGRNVWVPDSLLDKVDSIIHGNEFNPDEKVIVGNDTVPLYIPEKNIGRYSRGLFNYLFVPKGAWQFGLTAAYGEISTADLQMFDLLSDLDFSGHTFSIKPYISYFVRNNLSLGMRIGYNSAKGNLGELSMAFDDDLNLDISDVVYKNEALTAAIFSRQYIGLARNSRFGVFNELELAFSSGNSLFTRKYDSKPKTTNTTYSDLRLSFSPGLSVFINEYVSFNIAFAVVGFYLRNEKQSVDGEFSGSRFTSGANFRFNLFNINFGLGIHL